MSRLNSETQNTASDGSQRSGRIRSNNNSLVPHFKGLWRGGALPNNQPLKELKLRVLRTKLDVFVQQTFGAIFQSDTFCD